MKDPSCGPIGVLSLVIFCALKWAAVYVVLQQHVLWLLILTPMLARVAPLILFLTTPYVRAKGLGSTMIHLPRRWAYSIILLSGLGCSVVGLWGGVLVLVALVNLLYLRAKFIARIGGITGDTIGASIEIIESTSLFLLICSISLLLSAG